MICARDFQKNNGAKNFIRAVAVFSSIASSGCSDEDAQFRDGLGSSHKKWNGVIVGSIASSVDCVSGDEYDWPGVSLGSENYFCFYVIKDSSNKCFVYGSARNNVISPGNEFRGEVDVDAHSSWPVGLLKKYSDCLPLASISIFR